MKSSSSERAAPRFSISKTQTVNTTTVSADLPADATVLVVDDELAQLDLSRRILAKAQIACATTESPLKAIEILRNAPEIDVLVCDLRMPQMEGTELLREVRALFADRPWLQQILVTGFASVESAVSALRLEAADYLLKPVAPAALIEAVRKAQDRARAIRSSYRQVLELLPNVEDRQQLAMTARSLAEELESALDREGRLRPAEGGPSQHSQDQVELLGLMVRLEHERSAVLGGSIIPEPAWEMLAELMLAHLTGRKVSVTSLCLASRNPVTTAFRRINDLIRDGLALRVPDPSDGRRVYVELAPAGIARMQQLLQTFSLWLGWSPGGVPR